jgi:hypothetical protein
VESRPLAIAILIVFSARAAIDISPADAQRIGKRIWRNECGGTISGLTSWNAGENFASLGIGHFIWYPKGQRGPFERVSQNLLALFPLTARNYRSFLLPGARLLLPMEFQG